MPRQKYKDPEEKPSKSIEIKPLGWTCLKCGRLWASEKIRDACEHKDSPEMQGIVCFRCGRIHKNEKERKNCKCNKIFDVEPIEIKEELTETLNKEIPVNKKHKKRKKK